MQLSNTRLLSRGCAAIALGATLALAVSACAPEPTAGGGSRDSSSSAEKGADAGSDSSRADSDASKNESPDAAEADSGAAEADAHASASGSGKGSSGGGTSDGGTSWPETGIPGGGDGKSAELPASFPRDRFAVPAGAVVDDAGERSASEWFVVFRADDRAAAEAVWQAVASQSGFVVTSSGAAGDGGVAATYAGSGIVADALLIPQEDGSVLLSYDLALGG